MVTLFELIMIDLFDNLLSVTLSFLQDEEDKLFSRKKGKKIIFVLHGFPCSIPKKETNDLFRRGKN